MLRTWLRRLTGRWGNSSYERRAKTYRDLYQRPWIEALEERNLMATYRWNVDGGGNWNVGTNWTLVSGTGNAYPGQTAAQDIALFVDNVSTTNTVNDRVIVIPDANTIQLGQLQFGGALNTYTISSAGTGTLNMVNGGVTPTITQTDSSVPAGRTNTISAPLTATNQPLVGTISNGTLRITNTANNLGTGTPQFTVNTGGTLRVTGSASASAIANASIKLSGGSLTVDPVVNPLVAGLVGTYQNQTVTSVSALSFAAPQLTRGDAQVNFNFGTGTYATNPPASAVPPATNFGIRWSGLINLPIGGVYTFATNSDDGSQLRIDGNLVVDNDNVHTALNRYGTAALGAGLHKIQVDYFNGATTPAQVIASYTTPLGDLVTIPAGALWNSSTNDATVSLTNNDVSVTGTSSINITGGTLANVNLGNLSLPLGATLNINAADPRTVAFKTTTMTTGSGPAVLAGNVDIVTGKLADTGLSNDTLQRTGTGALILDSTAGNSLSGTSKLQISGGLLAISALSTGTNPLSQTTVVVDGPNTVIQIGAQAGAAAVTLDNAFTFNESAILDINGPVAASNTTVAFTLGGTKGMSIGNNKTLTVNVNAPNDPTLTPVPTQLASLTIAGGIGQVASTSGGNLIKSGNGLLTLTGANSFTGNTTLNGGQVTLSGTGTLGSTSNITVGLNSTLALDNTGLNNNNRIADAASLTMNGGNFTYTGNASVPSSETFATLTLASGHSTITSNAGAGQTATITITNQLARSAVSGATVNFIGTNLGTASNRILFTNAAPQMTPAFNTVGFLPYALVNTADFATYNQTPNVGIQAVTAGSYATTFIGANTGTPQLVKMSQAETLTQSRTFAGLITGNFAIAQAGFDITLSGGALFTPTGTSTFSGGNLNMGAEGIVFTNTGATTTLNFPVTGSAGLTISGLGTGNLILGNSNSYTGTTTLNSGTLTLATSYGISPSSGTFVLNNGTLQPAAGTSALAITIDNPVTLSANNNAFNAVTIAGTVPVTFRGKVTLTGNTAIRITNTAPVTFAGGISGVGAQLKLLGTGTVVLPAASDYSGGTVIDGPVVVIGNNQAFGSGTLTVESATIQATTPVTINNLVTLNGAMTLNSSPTLNAGDDITFSNTMTLGGGSTITANNNTKISGKITGRAGLALQGLGTVKLTGANDYIGGTILNMVGLTPLFNWLGVTGTLVIGNDSALSTGPIGIHGGTLVSDAPRTLSNSISLARQNGPTAAAPTTPLPPPFIIGGSNNLTFTGAVTLSGGGTNLIINNNTGTTKFTGVIGGPATNATNLIVNTTLASGTPGELVLTNAQTYTGATTISGGTVRLQEAATSLSTSFVLNTGGTLIIDNSAVNNTNRIADAATFNMNGGTLSYIGTNVASTNSTETINAITLATGHSTISLTKGSGGNAILTALSLTPTAGATVNFVGTNVDLANAAGAQMVFTNLPARTGSATNEILPYATITGPAGVDFATHGGAVGNSITRFTNYDTQPDINNAAVGSNYKLTSSTTNAVLGAAGKSLNAVLIVGTGLNLSGAVGATLTLTGAAILNVGGSNTISVPTVALAGIEGRIFTGTNATLNLPSAVTGTIGLTIGGSGTLALPNAEGYTGATRLNSGTLTIGSTTSLSNTTVTLIGGTLSASAAFPYTTATVIANNLAFNNSRVTFGGTNPMAFRTGTISLAGITNTIGVAGANTVIFDNVISTTASNLGNLTKTGTGTLSFFGANTYSGLTTVAQGILNVRNNTALGSAGGGTNDAAGTVVADGATLQVQLPLSAAGVSIGEPLILTGTGVGGIGALHNFNGTNTWTGNILLAGLASIGGDQGQLTISSGVIGAGSFTGAGAPGQTSPSNYAGQGADLIKTGQGTLVLSGANTYTGTTYINQGVVNITNAAALGSVIGGTIVATGATLQLGVNNVVEPLTLNGTGLAAFDAAGALSVTGGFTYFGNITVNTGSSVGVASGQTFTMNGAFMGTDLNKVGAGTLALVGNSVHSGLTIVSNPNNGSTAGILTLSGLGSALNTFGYVINTGTIFRVDNTGTMVPNRLGDSSQVILNGGLFDYLGNNTANLLTSETFGQIQVNAGNSTFRVTSGTGSGSINQLMSSGGISRAPGATVTFAGVTAELGNPLNQIKLSTVPASPTFINNVLPFAAVIGPLSTSPDFGTYDLINGITRFTNYKTSLAAAGPTDTVKLTTSETLTASKTVNAIFISTPTVPANTSVSVSQGNSTLTLASGGLLTFGGSGSSTSNVVGGTLASGTGEVIVGVAANTTVLNTLITGTTRLTISGGAPILLPNPNPTSGTTTVNLFNAPPSGSTTFSLGTLNLGDGGAVGTGKLVMTGGTIQGTASVTITVPYTLADAVVTIGGAVPVGFTGPGTVSGINTLSVTNTAGTILSGGLTGVGGALNLTGTGTLFLPTSNAGYTGIVAATTPILVLGDNASLGSGTVVMSGGGQVFSSKSGSELVINNPLALGGTVTFNGNNPITLGGAVNMLANTVLQVSNVTTIAGVLGEIGQSRTLNVQQAAGPVGLGTLTLNAANTYSGTTTVNLHSPTTSTAESGILNLGNNGALGYNSVTLTSGVLQAGTPLSINNAVIINTSTVANSTLVFSGTPTNTFTFNNNVNIAGASTLLLSNTTVTLTATVPGVVSALTGSTALTFTATPVMTQAGLIQATANGTFSLVTANTYTGAITMSGGNLLLSGAGTVTTASPLVINMGGTVTLDNSTSGVASPNRLPDATTITMNGGTLNFIGSNVAGVSSTETVGAITLAGGHSTISSTKGTGGNAILTSASLNRAANTGTVNFVGVNADLLAGGTNQINFTALPTRTGSAGNEILPYATVTSSTGVVDFATQAAINSSVTAFTNYDTSVDINVATTGRVFKLTAATANTVIAAAGKSFNAILISGNNLLLDGQAGAVLTLTGGAMLVAGSGTTVSVPQISTGDLPTPGTGVEGIFLTMPGSSVLLNTRLFNNAKGTGMTFGGTGSVTMPKANVNSDMSASYTGTVTLNGSTLVLGINNALPGPSAVTLYSGTIQANTPLTLPNTITFGNAGVAGVNTNVTFAGSNTVLSGAVNLTATGNNGITVNNPDRLIITGAINGAGALTINGGSGALVLTNNNGYTGLTTLMSGTVIAQNAGSLGTNASPTVVVTGATVQLQTGITLTEPLILNGAGVGGKGALFNLQGGNALAAAVVLNTDSTIGGDVDTLTFNAAVSGTAGLTKTGTSTLVFGAGNSYTGTTTISQGILQINQPTGLGTIAGGTLVADGASLSLGTGGPIVGEQLTLNGAGFGVVNSGNQLLSRGALFANAGTTWAGSITLNSDATFGVANALTVSGFITGSGKLIKVGSSTMTLQAANTYTGDTIVTNGTLTLNNSGSIRTSKNIFVDLGGINTGAALTLDNATIFLADRVGDTTNIQLGGGTLNFFGSATPGVAINEDVGPMSLIRGNSVITATGGIGFGGSSRLRVLGGLTRATGTALNFVGTGSIDKPIGSSGNQIIFTSSLNGDLKNGILPYSSVTTVGLSIDFATYDDTNGVSALDSSLYKPTLASAGPNDNVKLIVGETLTSNKTVNALLIVGNLTVNQANFRLGLTSGAILASSGNIGGVAPTGAAAISNGTVDFLGNEGFITNSSNLAISSVIANSAASPGLVLVPGNLPQAPAGQAFLSLGGSNVYRGQTWINAGLTAGGSGGVFLNNPTGLSNSTVNWTSGTVAQNTNNLFTVSNPLVLDNSQLNMAQGGNSVNRMTFAGPITAKGNNFLTAVNPTYLGGSISGSGALTLQSGVLLMNGVNTYTGGTNVAGGNLQVTNNSSLGTGTLLLFGGTIQAGGAIQDSGAESVTLNNPVSLNNSVATINGPGFAAGGTLTLGGTMTLKGTNTLTVSNFGDTFFTGKITGPGALIKGGNSQLTISNPANDYTGYTQLTLGVLTVGADTALSSGLVVLSNGVLRDDGSAPQRTLANTIFLQNTPSLVATTRLNLNGQISGTGSLNKDYLRANLQNSGAPNNPAGGQVLSTSLMDTTGFGILSLNNAETYTGVTNVNLGSLLLGDLGTILASASTLTVNNGASFTIDNTITNNTQRIPDGVTVVLSGGNLSFLGGNATGTYSAEVLSALTIQTGKSVVTSASGTNPGATALLSFTGAFTRNTPATVDFVSVNADLATNDNQIRFGSVAAGTGGGTPNGILPYATITRAVPNFAGDIDFPIFTTGTPGGIGFFTGYVNNLSLATAGQIVKLIDPGAIGVTVANTAAIGALLITGATSPITLGPGITAGDATGREPNPGGANTCTSPATNVCFPVLLSRPVITTISIGDVTVREGTGGTTTATFTVHLSQPVAAGANNVTVQYFTSSNTAIGGSDFSSVGGTTLTFTPGTLTQTVSITVATDSVSEPTESFFVNLFGSSTQGVIVRAQATGTIIDDDADNQISVGDTSIREADSGTATAQFTVYLSRPSLSVVTVAYTTADSTTTAGTDYTLTSGTVTFLEGATTATINVPISSDVVIEPDEQLFINLSNPVNATIARAQGTGTIINDDLKLTTVDYTTTDSTATLGGNDYTLTKGQLTFLPGQSIANVIVPILADALTENNEQFLLTLNNAVGAGITRPTGTGTIVDNWVSKLSIGDVIVSEPGTGTSTVSFTVYVDRASPVDISFDYATADGTAAAGLDYTNTSGTAGGGNAVTIAAGATSTTLTIPILADTLTEGNETFSVTLSNYVNSQNISGTATPMSATGTITDNIVSGLTISDVTVREPNSGSANVTFTVYLDRASALDVFFDYTTVAGTATEGVDYTLTSGTAVKIAAGTKSVTLSVPVLADNVLEAPETFSIAVSNLVNTNLVDTTGVATILDNALSTLAVGDVSIQEPLTGSANVTFTVYLNRPSPLNVIFDYTTVDNSATQGTDYTTKAATVTILAGATSATLTVPVLADTLTEGPETFFLRISNPQNALVNVPRSQGTGTILDYELPNLTISDVTVQEPVSGTANVTFTAFLNRTNPINVTFSYTTANNSAVAPGDYTTKTATVTIPAGTQSVTIVVPVLADAIVESDETFTVNLSNVVNANLSLLPNSTLPRTSGTATIIDAAIVPALTVGDVTILEPATGTQNVTFTVFTSRPQPFNVTFNYSTANVSATSGPDYTGIPAAPVSTGTILAGSKSVTITVPVLADVLTEGNETFTLSINTPTNATILRGTATATIIDNVVPQISIGNAAAIGTQAFTSQFLFPIYLSRPSFVPVTVNYTTVQSGTAQAGIDYVTTSGTVTFAPGQTVVTVPVDALDDLANNNNQTFSLNLSAPTNAVLAAGGGQPGGAGVGTGLLIDPAGANVKLSIADTSLLETHSGTTSAVFTIYLSQQTPVPITFQYESGIL